MHDNILKEFEKIGGVLPDLEGIAKSLEATGQSTLNTLVSPEVLALMTPDQRKAIKEARNAFKLDKNQTMSDKLASLQDTLAKTK